MEQSLGCKQRSSPNFSTSFLFQTLFLGYSFLLILQGPEAVAAALAGCKILKEMARLESEAESARSMKEAKYEQFALGECFNCQMTKGGDVLRANTGQAHLCRPPANMSSDMYGQISLVKSAICVCKRCLCVDCFYCTRCLRRVLLQQ